MADIAPERPTSASGSPAPSRGGALAPVAAAFGSVRGALVATGAVSLLINLLMLTGPLFMLQVYDRVLVSGSVPTLVVLGTLAFALYVFYGLLEGLRGRILVRIAQRVDARLSGLAYGISMAVPVLHGSRGARLRPVQDLDTVRQFLAGPGPAAIYDVPWLPFYLAIVFLFHSLLGFVALAGAVLISVLIILNEVLSRAPVAQAARVAGQRTAAVETGRRNAEAARAMGMGPALSERWSRDNAAYLARQQEAADRTGAFATAIKTLRFVLQSAILGVGAWLAIRQEISPGVMIAASIMTSRALAPVEQAIAHWRGFLAFRQGLARLREVLGPAQGDGALIDLPLPRERLSLDAVTCAPAGVAKPVVQGVTLQLAAGDGLGIIGPSGSGKSTLARAIVGAVAPLRGVVRFDGADLGQWPEGRRGRFIGYLPQDLQLFDGTIADNIARFEPAARSEAVIEAARLADVHDLVVTLPDGYNTVIGSEGMVLSAGQRQRIALARALYGTPFLVVLDEPNSNLDAEGDAALSRAIKAVRDRGSIVVVIAHRPSAIATVDRVLCLKEGQVVACGPKDEVLRKVVAPVAAPVATPTTAPTTGPGAAAGSTRA
ncbi:type I secretion system permease/ATPase [Polymorphum gilvum]|uniref:Protease/lipase ABC transporter n=1 Tax=Polymorphum gilvum (strain LMG 25793 / CGMCC 1.9160 / SL003B-26A1) TaxID=991905 RepID=F2J698_POLGS|nr:type I secretion system permease/ATPase [Polymorphum gilvum]ADZ71273.1 Protease/lipase ABC transporter [Polymorphum gilvum SL003B-26A1]